MILSDREIDEDSRAGVPEEFRRVIPSWVKQAVFKRDKGQCVLCGSTDQLHFDHDLPYAKGGTGLMPENVRILCARHNLSKGARIE
jgi:5-methylcytosine-specific restriction endonuclease McrA